MRTQRRDKSTRTHTQYAHLLPDLQGLLAVGFCSLEVSNLPVEDTEVVVCGGDRWVPQSKVLLSDVKSLVQTFDGLLHLPLFSGGWSREGGV